MDDWRTIKQNQPFARCKKGGYATFKYVPGDQDLYGDGYYGAHGGSQLSAIGGALRVGELVPAAGPIPHTLKVNIYRHLWQDQGTRGIEIAVSHPLNGNQLRFVDPCLLERRNKLRSAVRQNGPTGIATTSRKHIPR